MVAGGGSHSALVVRSRAAERCVFGGGRRRHRDRQHRSSTALSAEGIAAHDSNCDRISRQRVVLLAGHLTHLCNRHGLVWFCALAGSCSRFKRRLKFIGHQNHNLRTVATRCYGAPVPFRCLQGLWDGVFPDAARCSCGGRKDDQCGHWRQCHLMSVRIDCLTNLMPL